MTIGKLMSAGILLVLALTCQVLAVGLPLGGGTYPQPGGWPSWWCLPHSQRCSGPSYGGSCVGIPLDGTCAYCNGTWAPPAGVGQCVRTLGKNTCDPGNPVACGAEMSGTCNAQGKCTGAAATGNPCSVAPC